MYSFVLLILVYFLSTKMLRCTYTDTKKIPASAEVNPALEAYDSAFGSHPKLTTYIFALNCLFVLPR